MLPSFRNLMQRLTGNTCFAPSNPSNFKRTRGLRYYDGKLGAHQKSKVAKIAHALAERGSLTSVDIMRFRTTDPGHFARELRKYGYINRVTYEGRARIARYHYSGKPLAMGRAVR